MKNESKDHGVKIERIADLAKPLGLSDKECDELQAEIDSHSECRKQYIELLKRLIKVEAERDHLQDALWEAKEYMDYLLPMENESKDHGGVLLSDDLSSWRAKRPDEGTMDRFIEKAKELEAERYDL